jgi:hypothetical protein
MAECDHLWEDDYQELARWCVHAQPESRKALVAEAVLQARLALRKERLLWLRQRQQ